MRLKAKISSENGRRILMTATTGTWRPVITDHKSGFTIDYDPPAELDKLTELRFEVAYI